MRLRHVDEGYFTHLVTAIVFSVASLFASAILLIHALFPFTFPKTASKILIWIISKNGYRSNSGSQHIQIRYNTDSKNDILPWRIMVDGQEKLAQNIMINGKAFGEKTYVKNVTKYNIAMYGSICWHKDLAIITNN